MPKVDGPREGKTKMLYAVGQSIIFFVTSAWSETIKMEKYTIILGEIQRKMAIAVICTYRTISKTSS